MLSTQQRNLSHGLLKTIIMKLEPKAKPIRIRIKLGNSEHSSLDSVKSNFSIKELYPLFKDGRLERWLEQIGEKQFAHRTG